MKELTKLERFRQKLKRQEYKESLIDYAEKIGVTYDKFVELVEECLKGNKDISEVPDSVWGAIEEFDYS